MQQLRRTIQLKDGVGVEMLFTPHLFSYQAEKGLELKADVKDVMQVMEVYADIFYLASINAWELDGKGTVEDFPYTRGDFHEYMAACPKDFGKDVDFAVKALTGKTARQLVEAQKAEEEKKADEPEGKKKVSGWITRLLRRSS